MFILGVIVKESSTLSGGLKKMKTYCILYLEDKQCLFCNLFTVWEKKNTLHLLFQGQSLMAGCLLEICTVILLQGKFMLQTSEAQPINNPNNESEWTSNRCTLGVFVTRENEDRESIIMFHNAISSKEVM